jgi:hypothetical protein
LEEPFPRYPGSSHQATNDVQVHISISRKDYRTLYALLDIPTMRPFLMVKDETILQKNTFKDFPVEGR